MKSTERIQISDMALQAIKKSLETLFLPPVADSAPLRVTLSQHYAVPEECIVVGNGSTEIMNALVSTQTENREREILVSSPTFSLYQILSEMHEYKIRTVPLKDYAHDIKALRVAINEKTRIVFIDSPHYVTGTAIPTESIFELAEAFPSTVIVFDNVYGEFQEESLSTIIETATRETSNILICRSFSKAYALLGLRVGYAIGHRDLIARIQSRILPYSVNTIAQVAAKASICDVDNVQQNVAFNKRAKNIAYELLEELGISYVPTQSNTILMNFGGRTVEVAQLCAQYGIKCRDEKKCGLPGYMQVNLIDPETVRPFLEMLRFHFRQERR